MNIRLLIVSALLTAHQIACSSKKIQSCSSSSTSSSCSSSNSFASLSLEDEESGISDQDEPDMTEESEENESLQELLANELAAWQKLKKEMLEKLPEVNSEPINRIITNYTSSLTSKLDGNKDVSTTESSSNSLVLDSSKKKKGKNKGKGNSPKTTTVARDQRKEHTSLSHPKLLSGIDCMSQMVFNYGLVTELEKHEEEVRQNEQVAAEEKEKHKAYHAIINTYEKLASERESFLDNHPTVKKKCNKNELQMLQYFILKNVQEKQEFCLPCHKAINQAQTKLPENIKREYLEITTGTKTLTTNSLQFSHFVNLQNPQKMTLEELELVNRSIEEKLKEKTREVLTQTKKSIEKGEIPIPLVQHPLHLSS